MATMLNPNAIPDGSITQDKIEPSVLASKHTPHKMIGHHPRPCHYSPR